MVFARDRQDPLIRVFLAALVLLVTGMEAVHSASPYTYGILGAQVCFAFGIVFAGPSVELDLDRMRYRLYWFRAFARESAFKPLPRLDHIHVRDIRYAGGREDSSDGSWGDTYAYELSLMSVAKEKLVLCVRSRKRTIVNHVVALQERTGLGVRDVTQERIMGKA
jgi:hypothetical protein